jgi:ribosomal protein L37E
MSYRPGPDDVKCASCGEWYHKALKSCPMCDTPKASAARAALGVRWNQIQATPEEINQLASLNQTTSGCNSTVAVVLCLTGFGAVIGVPMLVYAWWQGNKKPQTHLYVLIGPCPYCGRETQANPTLSADRCQSCGKGYLVHADQNRPRFTCY